MHGSRRFHRVAVELALRRSQVKVRILVAAAALGPSLPARLAERARIDAQRLHAALHGRPPSYSRRLSMVRLGLVRTRRSRLGTVIELTALGKAFAERLGPAGLEAEAILRG